MTTSGVFKSCRLAAVLLSLCLPASLLGQPAKAGKATQIDVRNQIKSKVPSAIDEAIRDLKGIKLGSAKCQADFDKAVNDAKAEATACLNVDNPPAGSPIDKYNKFSQFQHDQFCGDLTAGACADKVLDDQKRFCAIQAAKEKAKAKSVLARCEAEIKQCDDARAAVKKANDDIVRLEKEVAKLKASLPGLEQKVTTECGR